MNDQLDRAPPAEVSQLAVDGLVIDVIDPNTVPVPAAVNGAVESVTVAVQAPANPPIDVTKNAPLK